MSHKEFGIQLVKKKCPVKDSVKSESIEEFKARGGKIEKLHTPCRPKTPMLLDYRLIRSGLGSSLQRKNSGNHHTKD